jgi:hypothetical protein
MRKNLYLAFAVLGLVIPYYFLFRFLGSSGVDIGLLTRQLFASDISTFFAADLILSVFVFWIWLTAEAHRLQMKNAGLYILATLTAGLSFALPLFLYFRERKLESQ